MESVPIMKKSCLFALLFSCIGTVGISQTVDISTLSDYEKQVHRVGWCRVLVDAGFDASLKPSRVFELYMLIDSNGFLENADETYYKAKDDAKKKVLLGELAVTQSMLDSCDRDLASILKEKYIPNFSYMEK